MRTPSIPRLATAVAVIAILLVTSAAAGAAGAALILGQVNSAGSSMTTLNSTSSNPTLRVNNNGGGRGVEIDAENAVPLRLIAPDGTAPLSVNTGTKVSNLNADRLDGLNSTAFLRRGPIVTHHLGPWVPSVGYDVSVEAYTAVTWIIANTNGAQAAMLYLPTPSSIGPADYGLSSVELCFSGGDPNVAVEFVAVDVSTPTGFSSAISDGTDHTISGNMCLTYVDATPAALNGSYTLWVRWTFPLSSDKVNVQRVEATWVPV